MWNRESRLTALLFLTLLVCCVYFLPRWADPNQNSRLDMVIAVVEDGTFQIDEYVANTVDYAKVGDHYYSDKAPGAAFLGIPVYAALKLLLDQPLPASLLTRLAHNPALQATLREGGSGLLTSKIRFAIAQVALTFAASALPTALLGALLYRLLARFTARPRPRIAAVLGYGLLTPAFTYAGAFYGHQLSAACLFAAFYLLFTAPPVAGVRRLLAVGFLLGYSVVTEYPSALIVGILFLYALHRLADKRRILWVILPGALVAAGWMTYNTALFGGPLALGYGYSELWQEQHHTGFMSLTLPHLDALWGITFGSFRGLFFISPVLLLAVPGFYRFARRQAWRAEFLVCLWAGLSFLLFNGSSVMWQGGYAVGPRYLVPMLPFLALPLALFAEGWGRHGWTRVLIIALSVWSFLVVWAETIGGQQFPDYTRNPLFRYSLPRLLAGDIARKVRFYRAITGVGVFLKRDQLFKVTRSAHGALLPRHESLTLVHN